MGLVLNSDRSQEGRSSAVLATSGEGWLGSRAALVDFRYRVDRRLALPAATTPALLKNAATNFKALLGSTPAVEDKLAVNKGTVTAWKQLKVMSAAEKAKAIEIAKLKMFEQWSASFDTAYLTADLDDYQKMTKCFAETVGTATPGAAGAGTNNWEVYSRMPVDLQTKIQTYMLEKLSARIV